MLSVALRNINQAAARVRPDGLAVSELSRARDALADVAAKRVTIENRIRMLQASATRGRGMSRLDLDSALERLIAELRSL